MGGRRVQSPDGATWIVRRRWVSWRPRWLWRRRRKRGASSESRAPGDSAWSAIDFLDLPDLDWLAVIAVAIVALVIFVFFVLPALFFLLQLLIFLVLLGATIVLRVVLRRPWVIDAAPLGADIPKMQWAVVGWWRSRRVIAEVAQALELGQRHIEPEGATLIRGAEPGKPG